MGFTFSKHVKGRGLSKIERRMLVNAGGSGKSSMRAFKSIITMFQKIDKTFEAVRDTFKRFHKNGNATLKLKDYLRELQVSFTHEEVKDLYAESDRNVNNGIDFKEFIVLLALLADAFVFFDKDCDGYVSKSKTVEAIGEALLGSQNASRIGLKRFEEMGWDKNNLTTFKVFLFAFTNWVGVNGEEEYSSD
ncbi:hypothetical protein L7F22_033261 [Adiantum nelumboides]|nr:hypothetical protein [Adiantum nelumboides]